MLLAFHDGAPPHFGRSIPSRGSHERADSSATMNDRVGHVSGGNRRSQIPCICAVFVLVVLAGCGESNSQKNARQQREVTQAISTLNEATHAAAEAGIEQQIAVRRHREALAKLRAAEAP